jgi:hypothetical protein
MLFADLIVALPGWARLRNVCGSASCVTPLHQVLQAPRTVARRLGYTHHDLRGIVELMRGRAAREPAYAAAWNTGSPQGLGLTGPEVQGWASRAAVPPLLVLAAFASLVVTDERLRERAGATADR